jgi:uncharacterized phage protein (TIGR01671 family)
MNRKIKFRVFSTKNKQYLKQTISEYRGEILLDLDGAVRIAEYPMGNGDNAADSVFEPVNDGYIVQQFTGLLDIKGKEIYEGDIIKLEGASYLYEIVWDNYRWGIDSKGVVTDFIQSFNIAVEDRAIVVGNIFENPNLLA